MTKLHQQRDRIRDFFRDRVPNDILEHRFARPERAAALGFPRSYSAPLSDGFGTLSVDLTIEDETGELICHEINGPNFQGVVALSGVDDRCRNEVMQTMRYARRHGFITRDGKVLQKAAVLFAHQPSAQMRTGSEFFERVLVYQHLLEAGVSNGATIQRRRAGRRLGGEDVALVWGDVGTIVASLSIKQGRFCYENRPLLFCAYPFILAEAVRQGKLPPDTLHHSSLAGAVDVDVFHGGRLLPLTWLKGVQQDLLAGTGITPLPYFEGCSEDAIVEQTIDALKAGPVVLKPNAASGGAGVELAVPGMAIMEILALINRMHTACQRKYGSDVGKVLYPVRGFRFVRSRGFMLHGKQHAWDLRIAALLWPGQIEVGPLTIRLAPAPFDPTRLPRDRDEWISNCSGRDTLFVRSPFDADTIEAVGVDEEMLTTMCDAASKLVLRALDWAWKQGVGKTHEDRCDTAGIWPYGRTVN